MQRKTASSIAEVLQFCIDHKTGKAGKLIQAHIYRTHQLSNTFLINRLIELYCKCGNVSAAHRLFDQMPARNIFSYHTLIDCYCKINDLSNAHDLFAEMPERNVVSWNFMVSAFSRNGLGEKAFESYYSMRRAGFLPTRFTLASVLSACGILSEMECGRRCHGVAIKLGLENNLYVGNALLGMYIKCDAIADARLVFEGLPEQNEVSLTTMIGGLVEAGRVNEAFEMFRAMQRIGIVDCMSVSSVLGVCSKNLAEEFDVNSDCNENGQSIDGRQVHGLVVKLGFDRDLHVNNSLLAVYSKHGYMEMAEILFNTIHKINVFSWNVMIAGFGRQGNKERSMEWMEKMQNRGFEPDDVTYVHMLVASLKNGDLETGRRMFNCVASPNLTSWNALLSGYSQNECHREAMLLFREMQFRKVRPDRTTFAIILSSCAGLGLLDGGKQIHAVLLKATYFCDLYVASGLIGVYSKCGEIEKATYIFDDLPEPDVVCWNSMLAGLSMNSLHKEAFNLFNQMLGEGILPTEVSYSSVLNSCSLVTSLSRGRQIHGLVVKDGQENDACVGTALISMYGKCGEVDDARQFFDLMPCKSTIGWNEMIHGYSRNGRGEEAVDLFERLVRSGVKPDSITFVAVLTACSHSGLVDVGLKIFCSMWDEYGVEPLCDHYTCIIDCLGRSGRFDKVEKVIDQMPYKDDKVVWEVLLSSCRVHGNVNLARRAADELFRLDPKSSAPYTLLANMYSSLNRWDDVREVRSIMNQWQVSKEPGYSWM